MAAEASEEYVFEELRLAPDIVQETQEARYYRAFWLVADKAHIEESCSLGVGCFGDFALERLWFSSGQMRVARSSDPELRAWGQHVM